ncbi:hypothetical protein M378DRAFT_172108 [Amanita muscaria Koide BX008]|uniref:Uncharacterized protein n=1 Tax=Amanita muscaria (strain Koide BX008) TaxID=946122 RepID=A0A0C2S3C4_AMAMK|nr:hypothetical protein M378DRAFT_172108 [Amanita muscaria Koide BX008]
MPTLTTLVNPGRKCVFKLYATGEGEASDNIDRYITHHFAWLRRQVLCDLCHSGTQSRFSLPRNYIASSCTR